MSARCSVGKKRKDFRFIATSTRSWAPSTLTNRSLPCGSTTGCSSAIRIQGTERIKLAVLPFRNVGATGDEDYFSEGLTEEMITEITRMDPENLVVIARGTALHFDASRESFEVLRKELGVSYVLEGKVRRSGSRVRITTQLTQLKDHIQLWAETYERDVSDVLTVQADIAEAITRKINQALKLPERSRPSDRRKGGSRVAPAAYEAYLRGRYSMHRMNPSAIERSVMRF